MFLSGYYVEESFDISRKVIFWGENTFLNVWEGSCGRGNFDFYNWLSRVKAVFHFPPVRSLFFEAICQEGNDKQNFRFFEILHFQNIFYKGKKVYFALIWGNLKRKGLYRCFFSWGGGFFFLNVLSKWVHTFQGGVFFLDERFHQFWVFGDGDIQLKMSSKRGTSYFRVSLLRGAISRRSILLSNFVLIFLRVGRGVRSRCYYQ